MISAFVPCFNNRETVKDAIESINNQIVPVNELFVIDDASNDGSQAIIRDIGVTLIANDTNQGRGAARSRAINESSHALVVSCDATNALAPDFLQYATPWFESTQVAAVFGQCCQTDYSTVALRWRARHLFKTESDQPVSRSSMLTTGGVLMRKSAILAVGNFNAELPQGEDADLGRRLLQAGYEVVHDPQLRIFSLSKDTIPAVLERYWRWNAANGENMSLKAYLKQIVYSIKVMARQDLQAGDVLSVPISLFSPHYQFLKSWLRRF